MKEGSIPGYAPSTVSKRRIMIGRSFARRAASNFACTSCNRSSLGTEGRRREAQIDDDDDDDDVGGEAVALALLTRNTSQGFLPRPQTLGQNAVTTKARAGNQTFKHWTTACA